MTFPVEVPVEGDEITQAWGEDVATAINELGRQPFAYANGLYPNAVSDAATALNAVAAGLGGAIAVPVFLSGPLWMQSVQIRQGSTASLRSCEFAVYREPSSGSATLTRITGTDGTFSFTPAAIDDREANISSPPTLILPGTVWVVFRNTSAAQTFQIRRSTPTELALNSWALSLTTASTAALGATIDLSGFGVGALGPSFVRIEGRVAGRTAAM